MDKKLNSYCTRLEFRPHISWVICPCEKEETKQCGLIAFSFFFRKLFCCFVLPILNGREREWLGESKWLLRAVSNTFIRSVSPVNFKLFYERGNRFDKDTLWSVLHYGQLQDNVDRKQSSKFWLRQGKLLCLSREM